MFRRLVLPATLAAAALAAAPRAARAQDFIVVVNAANPAEAMPKDQVAKIFLKVVAKMDNGVAAAPCANGASKALANAFATKVLGKSASALESYWQQQIFSGKDVPPPEKGSDEAVLAFVRATPGGIGYVAAGTALGAGVKALKLN